MPRDALRSPYTRLRIAQLAAQLMAEHGVKEHALAKRKAARQLGVEDLQGLPSNDEVDAELRTYVALFEPDSHERNLRNLRAQAIDVMTTLAPFRPTLTGAVAQGTASLHADIDLDVYADSSKEFEQFLLNRNIPFKSEERRGGSFFTLFSEPADVMVRVSPSRAMQSAARTAPEARRRLSLEQLQDLMASSEDGNGNSAPALTDQTETRSE
jgi:hypothetical protein